MTLETLLVSDLASRRYFEAFFGAGVCFYLGHFKCFFKLTLEASPHRRSPCRTSSGICPITGLRTIGWQRGRKDRAECLPGKMLVKKVWFIPGQVHLLFSGEFWLLSVHNSVGGNFLILFD